MFQALTPRSEGALVPFVMLGDPDPAASLAIIEALTAGGADALELGIPFSDPIADGPVIQRAAVRALAAGMTPGRSLELVYQVRARHPELPIGLLTYANPIMSRGLDAFYQAAAVYGADSVLVADVPMAEAEPFRRAARAAGVAPVFILPQDASDATVAQVARSSEGYTYVLGRAGVTGHESRGRPDARVFAALRAAGGAPGLVGFGIGAADQVREVIAAGGAGVIVGSAVVELVERYRGDERSRRIEEFVSGLKAATRVEIAV
jgi:tryptophan synthase alpha chain